jgi:hypothetical protein
MLRATAWAGIYGLAFRAGMCGPIRFLADSGRYSRPQRDADLPTGFLCPLTEGRECLFFSGECLTTVPTSDDRDLHIYVNPMRDSVPP